MIKDDLHPAGENLALPPDGLAAGALKRHVIAMEIFQAFVARPLGQHRGDDGGEEDNEQGEVEKGGGAGG